MGGQGLFGRSAVAKGKARNSPTGLKMRLKVLYNFLDLAADNLILQTGYGDL